MAINGVILEVIAKVAKLNGPGKILCLGYPDMLVTEPQLAAICGPAAAGITFREDTNSIARWHGLEGQIARIAETRSVFAALGLECDFVDIVASRGFEKVVDLNGPAPAEMMGAYDIVYDGGTMEHCFNVGQVMRNILGFTKVGGYIVHLNPMNLYGHGFFNFTPVFYKEWYEAGGNSIASPFFALHGPVLASQVLVMNPAQKFALPAGCVVLVVAKRATEQQPAWPMQGKYKANPELKGG